MPYITPKKDFAPKEMAKAESSTVKVEEVESQKPPESPPKVSINVPNLNEIVEEEKKEDVEEEKKEDNEEQEKTEESKADAKEDEINDEVKDE